MEIKNYARPKTLEEAHQILCASKDNALLGGGVWMKYTRRKIDTMIDLSRLSLNQINVKSNEVVIGAQTTLRDLETHPEILKLGEGFLTKAIGSIVGIAFRNIATIGGSIIGKYPFSDLITPLMCLDVELKFYPDMTLSLEEYLEHKRIEQAILTHIVIKKTNGKGYFAKVSNTALDFAILNVACYSDGIFRIAIGSRPGKPILALDAMKILNQSKMISEDIIDRVGDECASKLTFGDDERGSKAYREILAKTYVMRGIKEVLSS